ncbi:uncharacterized protein LOC142662249 [Rhinoderma darwinii]|uniref:uncharacterized protein LOC142662249 n=1 Tax=Rhinoderma darwinii TaxID=43563 RepID=UPI003F66D8BF
MDSYQGFEVGAEVELIDGPPVMEDSATVIVENKQDLPAWHHLHYVDDSSSDESRDSSEVKNMGTPRYMTDVKTPTEESSQLESKMFSTSEGLYREPPIQKDTDQSVIWSDEYNNEHRDQACPVGPGLEEADISHLTLKYITSPTRPSELYSEIIVTQESDEAEFLGKYSFYNSKTQCAGTVKPWVRSHKCMKCGRQFGRIYNLESHMCIKAARTRVNVDDINSSNRSNLNFSGTKCEQSEESMNRLEKMCTVAQKELHNLKERHNLKEFHNLKELYQNEEKKPPFSISVESQVESTQVERSAPDDKVFKCEGPFTCDRCGRRFRRRFNLGFHVCCGDKNMSAPQNTIVLKPDQSIAVDVLAHSDQLKSIQTNSSRDEPPRRSLDRPNEGKVFECQYCGKIYNRRASYGTHMRWHMKEKDLVSSVNKSIATGDLGPLLTTVDMTSVGSKKKTGPTFTCQECGRVFNKQCSYSTHTLWHNKRRNSGSALATPSVDQAVKGREDQVLSVSSKYQGSDETKAVSDNTFPCQDCGRAFNNRTAYSNHTRWHIKERELELSVKSAAQKVLLRGDAKTMGHQLKKSSKSGRTDMPFSCLEDGHFQDHCNLVSHLNLGEQQNLYIHEGGTENRAEAVDSPLCEQVELGQQRTPAEVPEFLFELVVGTESFREDLTSEDHQIIQNVEVSEASGDAEETTSRTQTSSLTSSTKEANERPVPLSLVFPYKLLGRLLKRPRPPHRCRDCGTCFSQSWKLKSHRRKSTMQRYRWKKHRCDCGRSPVGLLHFLRHQLLHLNGTTFICAVCGKLLRGYPQLRAHSWVHPLVSQFQCKCGARFTQLPRYLWHSLLNTTKVRRKREQKRPPKT